MAVTVGVLALQGAFHEHAAHINSLAPAIDVSAALVRTPTDLARCQALIIPGGESTAIALGAQRAGLIDPLRHWVAAGRPTWGTCAGMILLSNQAIGAKKGGQSLIGGVDIRVGRNGFGSQVDSFEAGLVVPALGEEPFPGVFIRAPVIDALLLLSDKAAAAALPGLNGAAVPIPASLSADLPAIPASHIPSALANGHAARANAPPPTIVCAEPPPPSPSSSSSSSSTLTDRPPIEIIASIPFSPPLPPKEHVLIPTSSASVLASESGSPQPPPKALATMATTLLNPEERPALDSQIVALRQGNILVSSFHPELTVDSRFHEYFVRSFVLGSS
ncbi:hypothetical protein CF328_g2857 [Tilletia controversa]|nr:hypothetical protein CF335_g4172 [Tilletia laevis]KAE8200815.1 hypothetical protein CF328_g2857 [Tilletia controversa]